MDAAAYLGGGVMRYDRLPTRMVSSP